VWYRGFIISEDYNASILIAQDIHNEKVAGFIGKVEEKLSLQKWPIRAMDGGR
jgi:hypothetical protein